MSDWIQLAVIIAISVPVGIALRIYLRYRRRDQADRLKRIGETMSWPYFAAGSIFFAALAIGSRDRLPFLVFFCVFAAIQLFWTVRVFLRERSQYSLLHLFIATAGAAIFAGFCRWFGMAMIVVAGVSAGVVVLVLFALEWTKHSAPSCPPSDEI